MPLIKCPDCDGKVSTKAAACPHCGNPELKTPKHEDPTTSADQVDMAEGIIQCPHCLYETRASEDYCDHCADLISHDDLDDGGYRASGNGLGAFFSILTFSQWMRVVFAFGVTWWVFSVCGDCGGSHDEPSSDIVANSPTSPTESDSIKRGETGYLWRDSREGVMIAASKEALNKVIEASAVNDRYGLAELVALNQVAVAPKNTKVLLLEGGFSAVKVRVISGPYEGDAGWVLIEALHKHEAD